METNPLPWYIAGPLIGLIVPLVLIFREKQVGVSSSFRVMVSFLTSKPKYFAYEKKNDYWQVFFVLGIVIISFLLGDITERSFEYSANLTSVYKVDFHTLAQWPQFIVGGFLIGFGSRYANGCTAGHCIMGMSQLAPASIIATIGFFIGGLISVHLINEFLY